MGRLSSQREPTIQHFSHPHPLQLFYHQSQQNLYLASCSGCELQVSGWIYACQICKYFLHVKCSEMPHKIEHPFDQNNHAFTLLATPTYPEGFFNCDACGKLGNGFSYHCKICGFDLHILCASMPLSVAHHQYHHHQLNLQFSPPYANKSFSCDICKQVGSDHWLYRCDFCNFDAHLTCAGANPPPPPPATAPAQTPIQPIRIQPYQITPTAPVQVIQSPFQVPIRPIIQLPQYQPTFPVRAPGAPYGARPLQTYPQNNNMVNNNQNNSITNQIIQGLVDGVAQAAGQVLFQGFMGGGDGGASDGSSFSGDQ